VTDDQYRSIVGSRLDQDDFIIDDDGSGYVDNGMDDWDNAENGEESEDEDDFEGEDEDLRRGESSACPRDAAAHVQHERPNGQSKKREQMARRRLLKLDRRPKRKQLCRTTPNLPQRQMRPIDPLLPPFKKTISWPPFFLG